MPSVAECNTKSPLTIGNRVVVNGIKSGTLRYVGTVQFAQGYFCGVELDKPEGKHDGEVQAVRYFQCAPNHGIFVPRDKVVLEPQPRPITTQRPVSRLKAPTVTRSITPNPTMNKIEPPKSVQLPDIVPTSNSSPVTPVNEVTVNDIEKMVNVNEPAKVETVIEQKVIIEPQTVPIDEAETMEADFTASVSLILHQLQQEQKTPTTCSSSIVASEEETEEDADDDDDDEDDESVIDDDVSTKSELCPTSQPPPPPPPAPVVVVDLSKSSQTDLSFQANETVSFTKGIPRTTMKISPSIPMKKNIERKPHIPTTKPTNTSIISRKPALTPLKKGKTQLNSAQSVASLPSRSQLNSSLSSLNSSQSDLTSTAKRISDAGEHLSKLNDLPSPISEKKLEESHHDLQNRLIKANEANRSLELTIEQFKRRYHQLIDRFEVMNLLSQYYILEKDQLHERHARQLSKAHARNQRLKTTIEQLRLSHLNEITTMTNQFQSQSETLTKSHRQNINEYEQKIVQLTEEKDNIERRCASVQEQVDAHLAEMANSEHADALLCHVERLEKDRTSLQTVLDMKTREVAQLRTKLNEQVFQLEDKIALQKRIDMAENRNQDLVYLLRQRQLTEKAALVERDEMKEQVSQLERDNQQLKFENEALLYRLRQQTMSKSMELPTDCQIIATPAHLPVRARARSFSSAATFVPTNEQIIHWSSLQCILQR